MRSVLLVLLVLAGCGEDDASDQPVRWNGLPLGSGCAGVGVCAQTLGVVEEDGVGGAICSTVPGGSRDASTAETCDSRDNDCNGETDDVAEGSCERCAGLDAPACEACEAGDERGVFEICNVCSDCDRISGPQVDGFICGCTGTEDCPCGFVCGEIAIGSGVFVAGCAPP